MTLKEFFKAYPKVALAYSGGVDSSWLLYAAMKYGTRVRAYYVKSAFQPEFEWEDACRLAKELGADLKILELDILMYSEVTANPDNRCYYCKGRIFGEIQRAAAEDGFSLVIDGTNASDDAGDRPGMKALQEMAVRSPLRECGLEKEEIRKLSREAGLFTWNKPAYACLATRIPTGSQITAEKLRKTEKAEKLLFSMGFQDFRVRMLGETARLQVQESQLSLVMEHRQKLLEELKKYYSGVLLDLEVRSE
ncbi:MAG: ATP-dependent sacrificial sulfur transferase LarE [Lachnospiraceae bacterium]|nr:ATP-dependent sacrificial sulfur transferase LarE [Lachnospiraceae bacterium]